ncbi:MAG: betaine-aldehyde dehydrogenase [Alphaproteobacteria bacterium]
MQFDTQPTASHFIDGKYVEDKSGAPIDVVFPATGEKVAEVYEATASIQEKALTSSQIAFYKWSQWSGADRAKVLSRTAGLLKERNSAFATLETIDTGRPLQETLVADALVGADALDYFAGMARTLTGDHYTLGEDFAYTRREPLGVCLGIGAWNYPTQIACWKAAPALASGNSVVMKPSEVTPLGTLKLAELFMEAGAPAGLFNVVQGRGQVASNLVSDNRVRKVSLTGSVPTGQKVYSAAGSMIKYVTMELGGKSPLIIFDDADVENAVSGALLGNMYSAGQVCSNGTRVFVQRGIKNQFIERFSERAQKIRLGNPLDLETEMGPLASQTQMDKVLHYIEIAKEEGARLVCGGERDSGRNGFFVKPTIFADVTDEMTIAKEEIFGPVASVLDFDSEDEVVERSNTTAFGLAAGVFTSDLKRGHRVVSHLEAGTCWINTFNQTPVEVPFGGYKMSGIGRENSARAIEHYTQLKTVYVGMGDVESPY